jgi:hypothetical protein
MGPNIALSVIFLMIGGTGFALPDWVNIYDFYRIPSSGSLDPATATAADTDIHNASHMFSTVPKGGFGPPTASFQIQNRLFSVVQPNPALQFKDRCCSTTRQVRTVRTVSNITGDTGCAA